MYSGPILCRRHQRWRKYVREPTYDQECSSGAGEREPDLLFTFTCFFFFKHVPCSWFFSSTILKMKKKKPQLKDCKPHRAVLGIKQVSMLLPLWSGCSKHQWVFYPGHQVEWELLGQRRWGKPWKALKDVLRRQRTTHGSLNHSLHSDFVARVSAHITLSAHGSWLELI